MGLGKTVQAIAFLASLYIPTDDANKQSGPHLIVVPASTLSNWERELMKICPKFRIFKYYGMQDDREEMRRKLRFEMRGGGLPFDVMFTTYSYFERDSGKEDRSFLGRINFEYLILDEAHAIKNMHSTRSVNLANLRARRRLLLTGMSE
jgi:SWI/SNF-related matrix-associated actin-dependent regulator 1 of chromatin subfamily A